MVVSAFVGALNSAFIASTDNEFNLAVREDTATPALDEIPLRMSADWVYDSESDRAIFFGGSIKNLEVGYNDTWSYDYNTNTWTNMSPATNPPASEWYQMTYDSTADRVVLFGGHVSGSGQYWLNHNETWVYDFNTNTWTDMAPTLAPPAMCGGIMEYDSESDLIVLYGGAGDGGTSNILTQTWTYNLTSNTWTNVTTGVHPSERTWAASAYDSDSDLIVLFGGLDWDPYSTLTDTWTYDVDTNTWAEVSTAGPDIVGEFAYDSESDKLVFFGGTETYLEDIVRSETWQYDTDTETWEMKVLDTKPDARSRGELIYDSESDRVLLYEGVLWGGWENLEEVLNDCWVYDLNNNLWNNVDWDWQEMTPTNSPGARCGSPLVYDIESDRMVIFSGWNNLHYDGDRYNDTWTYNFNTNEWLNMSPVAQPAGRGGHTMAYSEKDDVIVMFGGSLEHQTNHEKYIAQTWIYDLNTNTWTNMSPSSNPNPSIFASMTYDNESDVFVLFGGYMQDYSTGHETWIYNLTANSWTNVTTSTYPEGRFFASMMDKPGDDTILLASGGNWDGYVNDVWSFNVTENSWTEILSTTESPDFGLGMAYDLESDLLVGTGGPTNVDEDEFVSETWKFNLTSGQWDTTFSPNNPVPRSRMYLTYDIESDRTLMFGGALPDGAQGETLGDTWAYDSRINPLIILYSSPRNPAANLENNDLVLTWESPVPISGVTVLGYNVYRGSESGEYELLAELGDVLTYIDRSAGYGIPYFYVIAAVSVDGVGDLSDEVTATRAINKYDDQVYRFIAYGDTRASDETAVASIHDDLVSRFLQHDPEMIIHTGDMVNHGGEEYQWPLFSDSISAIYDWDPNMKFYSAVGNHEKYTDVMGVDDEDYSTYRDFFDFSDVIDEEGETELYYSYDWQGIHFIVLNTADEWNGDVYTCPTAQMDWLENDLAEDYAFTIVITHYPFYSILKDRPDRVDQAESLRSVFHELFNESGVDIVFSGHNHYYHRTVRDEIQYITVAGGGAPLYDCDTVQTDWQTGDVAFGEYHYLVAAIMGNNLEIEVQTMNGTIRDSFTLELNPASGLDPLLIVAILGGVAIVAIVLVIYIRKKR